MITIKRISAKTILSTKIHETLVRLEICEFSVFSDLTHTPQNLYVMALRQKIEWDPEEVAAGYDLSSIYEEVVDNSTAPVISSAVNTTDLVDHPAINITTVVKEVARQVVERVVNATTTTTAPITVAPPTSSLPASIPHLVKKAVEYLGREPSSPVAMVCII